MPRWIHASAALLIGIALGSGGWRFLAPSSAGAQVGGGFFPISVSASQGGNESVAWFIGRTGTVEVCASHQSGGAAATVCQPVHFAP
jgi:hypothetical protein